MLHKPYVQSQHLRILITFRSGISRPRVTATSYKGPRAYVSKKHLGDDDTSAWELQGSGPLYLLDSNQIFKFIAFLPVVVMLLRVI